MTLGRVKTKNITDFIVIGLYTWQTRPPTTSITSIVQAYSRKHNPI